MLDFLFQIFENVILFSGPFGFFYGMGKNQNSGKLLFRNISQTGSNGLCITETDTTIDISTTASGVSAIETCRVAFGTGNNITSDEMSGISEGSLRAIVGARSFSSGTNFSTQSTYDGNDLSISGKYNKNYESTSGPTNLYNILIGGYSNCACRSRETVIIGGCCNVTKLFTCYGTMINSRNGSLYGNAQNTIINSGYCQSGVPPFNEGVSTINLIGDNSKNVSIINAYSCLPSDSTTYAYRSGFSSIIGSSRTRVSISNNLLYYSSVISSDGTYICSQGNYNNSSAGYLSGISVISSCRSKIYGGLYNSNSILSRPTRFSSIISSCFSQITGSCFSSIISSKSSTINNNEQTNNSPFQSIISGATILSSLSSCIENQNTTAENLNSYYNRYNSIISSSFSCILISDSTSFDGSTLYQLHSSIIASNNSKIDCSKYSSTLASFKGNSYRSCNTSIIGSCCVFIDNSNFSTILSSMTFSTIICSKFSTIISSQCSTICRGSYSSIIAAGESCICAPKGANATSSVILSGFKNFVDGSAYAVIIGGYCNKITNNSSGNEVVNSTIIGGSLNNIVRNSETGTPFSSVIISSKKSSIGLTNSSFPHVGSYNSIFGGYCNIIDGNKNLVGGTLCSRHSVIIGGKCNQINGSCYTIVLGGQDIIGGCTCPNFTSTTGVTPSNFNTHVPNLLFNCIRVSTGSGFCETRFGRICGNLTPTGGIKIRKGLVVQ